MKFDYSESFAAQLTATYISINFIIHLFAGCLINRTFRANDLLTLSIVLSIIGCFIMANSQSSTIHFTYGLSIQAISSGLATTCINCILNKNSNQKNTKQYKAKFFIINYSYMNIGFIIGLAISGYYQVHNTSSILFNICNIFNLIALLVALIGCIVWFIGEYLVVLGHKNDPIIDAAGAAACSLAAFITLILFVQKK